MNNGIYAVYDNKADTIVGGLYLHRADPAAIRMYGDIASDPKTMVGMHTEDYDLLLLGTINNEDQTIDPVIPPRLILTGRVWLAAQQKENTAAKPKHIQVNPHLELHEPTNPDIER